MTKNILIIGNGFDLEHGLPTRYIDFLKFISKDYEASTVYKLVKSINCIEKKRNIIKNILGSDNSIINYISDRFETNKKIGKNWVDFESELARVVKYAERYFYGEIIDLNEQIEYDSLQLDFDPTLNDSLKFHEDFYRLLCAFEIYISDIINRIECNYYNEDIKNIRPDIVISLNYSNTYERIYSRFQNVDYIHGKASLESKMLENKGDEFKIENYRDSNHIILGMDEYLTEDNLKEKTEFIAFRKYFQRITKHTGVEYRKYLENDEKDNLNIYVFGHSLDPTDSELIKEIIGNKNARTTIFYHNESAYISEVTNLIRIFGKDYVIDRCHGENPIISFRKQKQRITIENNNNFNFSKAVESLSNFTKLTSEEFIYAYNLISSYFSSLRGFESQIDVIRVNDVLKSFGFAEQFKENSYELIKTLPAIDNTGTIVNSTHYNLEEWIEPTIDGRGEVPKEIEDLLILANSVNDKRAQENGVILIGSDDYYIHPYEKNIPREINQKEYTAFVVRMINKLRYNEDITRVWELLKCVTVNDSTLGAQVCLQEIKSNRDDDFSKAVCNYLENYIDQYAEEVAYFEWVSNNYKDE